MEIIPLLKRMVEKEVSDLHLKAGSPPTFRLQKELVNFDEDPLKPQDTEEIARALLSEKQLQIFKEKMEMDFSYSLSGVGRFRVNVFRQRGTVGLVIRRVKTEILSFEELGLPPVMEKIALSPRGLIIVCGAASSGKSTTLAAMIDFINNHRRCHIVTIEDPVEFLHHDKKSIITQREVGMDTESFTTALRHVVRQDPDVIMIGELRDMESFSMAMTAAETGHLILTTLHASDVSKAFNRVMDFFPPSLHYQIRMQMALNLRAIIAQRLLQRADEEGLVPAVEILLATPTVSQLIRDDRLEKLEAAIQTGTSEGMQTFNQSLVKLVNSKIVTYEEAMAKSSNPEALKMNLQGIFLDEDRQILGG